MPLVAAGLSAAIKAEMDASSPTEDAETGESGAAARQEFADALAKAIVDYLIANALITTTVTGTSASGGPVTGTGTGTIS